MWYNRQVGELFHELYKHLDDATQIENLNKLAELADELDFKNTNLKLENIRLKSSAWRHITEPDLES